MHAYPKLLASRLSGKLSTLDRNNTEPLTLWNIFKSTFLFLLETGLLNTHVLYFYYTYYRFATQERHGLKTALSRHEFMTLSKVPELYKISFLPVKWEQKRAIKNITSTSVCVMVVFLGVCSLGPK